MMFCQQFAHNYCKTTLIFTETILMTCDVILVKHLTARNFKLLKSLCALRFIQITGPMKNRDNITAEIVANRNLSRKRKRGGKAEDIEEALFRVI